MHRCMHHSCLKQPSYSPQKRLYGSPLHGRPQRWVDVIPTGQKVGGFACRDAAVPATYAVAINWVLTDSFITSKLPEMANAPCMLTWLLPIALLDALLWLPEVQQHNSTQPVGHAGEQERGQALVERLGGLGLYRRHRRAACEAQERVLPPVQKNVLLVAQASAQQLAIQGVLSVGGRLLIPSCRCVNFRQCGVTPHRSCDAPAFLDQSNVHKPLRCPQPACTCLHLSFVATKSAIPCHARTHCCFVQDTACLMPTCPVVVQPLSGCFKKWTGTSQACFHSSMGCQG